MSMEIEQIIEKNVEMREHTTLLKLKDSYVKSSI